MGSSSEREWKGVEGEERRGTGARVAMEEEGELSPVLLHSALRLFYC
jgi:hypothetical protein